MIGLELAGTSMSTDGSYNYNTFNLNPKEKTDPHELITLPKYRGETINILLMNIATSVYLVRSCRISTSG